MAGAAGSQTRKPERRSHAERTAETRGKILRAVVASIAEVGFQRRTANEITRRAGVTWGAVQHHFGGKDGILLAVLEDSFDRFAARLADIPVEGTSLEERVSAILGGRQGYNGSKRIWRLPDREGLEPGRILRFGGCQHIGDERAYQGQPHDLIAFDEIDAAFPADHPRVSPSDRAEAIRVRQRHVQKRFRVF